MFALASDINQEMETVMKEEIKALLKYCLKKQYRYFDFSIFQKFLNLNQKPPMQLKAI